MGFFASAKIAAANFGRLAKKKIAPAPVLNTDHKEALELSGALEGLKYMDLSPLLGREYKDVDLVDLLQAPNSDDLIRDLAITSEST